MKRPNIGFPSIKVEWSPRFTATGYFIDSLSPDPPYGDFAAQRRFGDWTEWIPDRYCGAQVPDQFTDQWWIRAWLRLEYLYEQGYDENVDRVQKNKFVRLFSNRTDKPMERPLHERFAGLCKWPQDPEPVLEIGT